MPKPLTSLAVAQSPFLRDLLNPECVTGVRIDIAPNDLVRVNVELTIDANSELGRRLVGAADHKPCTD